MTSSGLDLPLDGAWLAEIKTPAYVFDEAAVLSNLDVLAELAERAGLIPLYSLKAACDQRLLRMVAPKVSGFSVSSLFETRLAKSVCNEAQSIHLTSPRIQAGEIEELSECRGFVSFNSLEQARRLSGGCREAEGVGLRVNPGISLVNDARYDPCLSHSKLGVPLADLQHASEAGDETLATINGLHFHTNCEAGSYDGLYETVREIISKVPDLVEKVAWFNLGGGYLFADIEDSTGLLMAVDLLKHRARCQVFFEPGAGVVQEGVYLVSEVVDLFTRDGLEVAVLDTSVSHWPEVFEYQFAPDLHGHVDDGDFRYLLAGCSCLAGDVFGHYALTEPLRVGSRVAFTGAGAYSFVKANYFNGINLPSIYWLESSGELVLSKSFTFADFLARNGV